MSRQANGQYLQPAATAAVSGQTISSTAFNTLITDIGTEITNSVDRGGRSAMTAALPMGSQKITGMAEPTVSTDGATKNYVDTTTAAFFSTGDVKLTLKNSPDTGWVMFDDGTIGSAASGASSYANALAQPLFTLIFNNIPDANAPILTSGGGATTRAAQTNASSAWAANCRISLPRMLGRVLGIVGTGSGLSGRSLGQLLGEENHTLSASEIPSISSTGSASVVVSSDNNNIMTSNGTAIVTGISGGGSPNGVYSSSIVQALGTQTSRGSGSVSTSSSNTGNGSHNNMQPTVFLNCMVKL